VPVADPWVSDGQEGSPKPYQYLMSTKCLRAPVGALRPLGILLVAIATVAVGVGEVLANPIGTQTVALKKGWNAVAVRVDPASPAPNDVFRGLPVDKVAAYLTTGTPLEYIQDPAAQPWKQKGWRAWFNEASPDAFISDLSAIQSGQCYLVHATEATTLNLSGTVAHHRVSWRGDSFNMVGFPVDPEQPPTFSAWFAGSAAHQSTARTVVYQLDETDRWAPVTRPERTLIQPDRAYWVWCQGASDYQGPLDVIAGGARSQRVNFGDVTEVLSFKLVNNLNTPVGVLMQLSPTNGVPVLMERKLLSLSERVDVPLTESVNLGTLEPKTSRPIRLKVDRSQLATPGGSAVLVLKDDVGTLLRIPVTADVP
jgi:hypothetical protein